MTIRQAVEEASALEVAARGTQARAARLARCAEKGSAVETNLSEASKELAFAVHRLEAAGALLFRQWRERDDGGDPTPAR